MEEFQKLGAMDFEESMDYSDLYINDLSSPPSTSLESGYDSQSTHNASSFEFNSLPLEGHSSHNGNTEDVCSLHHNNIEMSDSNYSDDNISTQSNRTVKENSCERQQTNRNEKKECIRSGDIQCQLIGKGPIQESCDEVTFHRNIHRNDSCDIIEEKSISIDETDRSIYVRDTGHVNAHSKEISRNTTQEVSKPHCNCKQQRVLNTTRLDVGKDWVLLDSRMRDGYFIADSSQGFKERFQLMSGDRLISVNEEDIHHLSHNDVVRRIREVIHMKCRQLVIERHNHTEDREYIEIMRLDIQLEFLEEDGGNAMLDVTARILRKISRRFRVICNLQLTTTQKCWISYYTDGKKKYLCQRDEDSDELTMAFMPNIEDPKFQFSRATYHGFRREGGDNKELYLITLMCKATDGYISVGTKGSVKLKRYETNTERMTSILHPLPQMFICKMYQNGKYSLESLNHEGWFLCWNTITEIMEIKKVDDQHHWREQPEILFSIYTDDSKVI